MSKITLFLSTLLFCECIYGNAMAEFSDIVKKDAKSSNYCPASNDGEICLMTWSQAMLYCKSQKAHVPTAREYANHIKAWGTVTLETNEVTGTPPKGFYLVDCLNPDGAHDSFYMNHRNYQRRSGESGNHLLWTASIPPQHPEYAHVYYDEWGGGGGDPKDHLLTHTNAVQCVSDR